MRAAPPSTITERTPPFRRTVIRAPRSTLPLASSGSLRTLAPRAHASSRRAFWSSALWRSLLPRSSPKRVLSSGPVLPREKMPHLLPFGAQVPCVGRVGRDRKRQPLDDLDPVTPKA